MRTTNSSYLPVQSLYPFEGVDYLGPTTQIGESFASEMLNMDTTLGHLTKRKGYAAFGGALTGVVLALIEFKDISSVTHLVAITDQHEYKWDGSAWQKITYKDNGGTEHARTANEDAGIDYAVVTGVSSTGAIVTWLIITNGVDKPRYWDGSLATFYEYSTASVANHGAALLYTGFVTCKTISTIQSYVVLGNVTTSAPEPNVIVWGDTQSLFDFENNNSGAVLLTDATFSIQKILPLGDALMIYSDDSIHSMIHIGAESIFSFQRILTNTRLLGGRAIVDVGPFHYFMAQETIYLFDGTRGLRRLGDRITNRYRDIFLSDLKTRAWAFLDQPKNAIYFAVPTSATATTIFKAEFEIFDVTNLRWDVQSYASRITCMGFSSSTQTIRWQDIPSSQTWAQSAGTWNKATSNKGFPRRLLGIDSATKLADDTVFDDDSTAVTASWESKDFTIPRDFLSEFARWTELEVEARGTSMNVSFSTDKGFSYGDPQIIDLDGSWRRYRIFIDSTSPTLRVRISNENATENFGARWFRLWFTHSGADD